MHYILFYDYIPDILEKRPPHRVAHLSILDEMHAAGKVRLAGAYTDPADGAAIVFTDRAAAEEFMSRDPYISNGLVTSHRIREWNVVVGE